jgi:hypothetical protein
LNQIVDLLSHRISSAETSPAESDAIAMLQAKEAYETLLSKSREGFGAVKERTLASLASTEAPQQAEPAKEQMPSEQTSAENVAVPTLLQSLQTRAYAGWQAVNQAAADRVEVAKAGKRLLDEGGEAIARLVAAKKTALEAAAVDRDFANRVQSAILLLEDSATLLKKSSLNNVAESGVSQEDFARLIEEHEDRARVYRQVAGMIQAPAATIELSVQEWDALAMVKVKEGCSVMTQKTTVGVGHVKTRTAAACA